MREEDVEAVEAEWQNVTEKYFRMTQEDQELMKKTMAAITTGAQAFKEAYDDTNEDMTLIIEWARALLEWCKSHRVHIQHFWKYPNNSTGKSKVSEPKEQETEDKRFEKLFENVRKHIRGISETSSKEGLREQLRDILFALELIYLIILRKYHQRIANKKENNLTGPGIFSDAIFLDPILHTGHHMYLTRWFFKSATAKTNNAHETLELSGLRENFWKLYALRSFKLKLTAKSKKVLLGADVEAFNLDSDTKETAAIHEQIDRLEKLSDPACRGLQGEAWRRMQLNRKNKIAPKETVQV